MQLWFCKKNVLYMYIIVSNYGRLWWW